MHIKLEEDVLYLYALSLLKGFGVQTVLRIAKGLPSLSRIAQFSCDDLQGLLGPSLGKELFQNIHQRPDKWKDVLERAENDYARHLEQDIFPIAITSDLYPPLLKLIPDPPPILYAKGNIALLHTTNAVAIIGTREPTSGGLFVARHLASQLAQHNYTIVSGLAKGIDRAAHEGALEAKGKTVAVFGTSLETVYPAEHRSLAASILAESGVLISELALGQRGFRTAFVRRDRIQSGLSLAILPIQTRNDGGTMHTVHFARTQNRLVVCPKPLSTEAHALQYEGIRTLINEGWEKTPSFAPQHVSYEKLLSLFQRKLHELLDERERREESKMEKLPSPKTSRISVPTSPQESTESPKVIRQQEPFESNLETIQLPLIDSVLSSTQDTPQVLHEVSESYFPSSQILLWERESSESVTPSTNLATSQTNPKNQSNPRKKSGTSKKRKDVSLKQLEVLDEQTSQR